MSLPVKLKIPPSTLVVSKVGIHWDCHHRVSFRTVPVITLMKNATLAPPSPSALLQPSFSPVCSSACSSSSSRALNVVAEVIRGAEQQRWPKATRRTPPTTLKTTAATTLPTGIEGAVEPGFALLASLLMLASVTNTPPGDSPGTGFRAKVACSAELSDAWLMVSKEGKMPGGTMMVAWK